MSGNKRTVTASTALTPVGCPPPWAVRAAGRAAGARAHAAPRALRVPLVAADDWFWDLVGVDEVVEPAPRLATDDRAVWAMAVAPAALLVQVALTDGLRLAVPGWVLFAELLVVGWLLALADAKRLLHNGVAAPAPWLGLLPPAYLFRRAAATGDLRTPVAWFVVAAAAVVASLGVDARMAPVPLGTQAVESTLYEKLFEGQLPLDRDTGVIRCPAFTSRWVGQDFRCTGTDAHRTVPLEVSVLDRSGALSWQPLTAAP